MQRLFTLMMGVVALPACTALEPRPIVTRTGVVDAEVRQEVITSGEIYSFVQAERLARPYAASPTSPTPRRPTDPVRTHDMLEAGFAAVYASCDDFFRSSGRDQTKLLVLRDIIGTLASLAGGALALIDRNGEEGGLGNENALAAISFGSSAALSGIDIYTQRFLFGAENISAVRDLTQRALDEHRAGVLETPPLEYERVLVHIRDNQAICTTRHIARLAREAIAAGDIETAPTARTILDQANREQDEAALARLGQILDHPGPLTAEQALGLWWLLLEDNPPATDAEISGRIKELLAGLLSERSPLAEDGTRKPEWAAEANARDALRDLSEPTLRAFREQVAAGRAGATLFFDAAAPSRTTVREPRPVDRRVDVRVRDARRN